MQHIFPCYLWRHYDVINWSSSDAFFVVDFGQFFVFLGYYQKIIYSNVQEFYRKYMAQFLHGKTVVCSFMVKTWSITKRNSSKRSYSSEVTVPICLWKRSPFIKLIGNHLDRRLYLMQLQASSKQLYWKRDPTQMISCNFYEVFKNTFFVEPVGATTSEPSNQTVCSDIIKEISKWNHS